ncbi:MAG: hypothetical protein IPM76_10915 [Chloroflexi bacterium]|nr:hypothetical protein [Chloroflexota bacterium]
MNSFLTTGVIASLVYGPYRPALKRRAAKRRPVNGAFSSFSRFQPALLRSRGVYASAKPPYGPYRPALKRRAAKRRPVNGAFSSFSRFQPALLRSRGVYASAKPPFLASPPLQRRPYRAPSPPGPAGYASAKPPYGPYRPALKRRAAKRRPVNGAFSSFSRFQPALLRSRGVYASAKPPRALKLCEYKSAQVT